MPKYWGGWVKSKRQSEKRIRRRETNNNGQLRIANATSGGVRKAAWAKNTLSHIIFLRKK